MLEKTNKILVPNFVTPCYEPPSGVPRLTPAYKKYPLSKTWAGVECDGLRRRRSQFWRIARLRTTERCSLSHPCPQKISATINGYGYFWWAGVDSDHRSQVTTDLQSVPFGRSGTYPYMWSWRLESNPQPADYKSAALPIELHQQFF